MSERTNERTNGWIDGWMGLFTSVSFRLWQSEAMEHLFIYAS